MDEHTHTPLTDKPPEKKSNLWAVVLVIAVAAIIASMMKSRGEESTDEDTGVQACVERGITYYKDIGSYPTLSNGENAETKVAERCSRTSTAF